jgi:predicted nucleic acid-binding protein
MALVKVGRAAQITLPAEIRKPDDKIDLFIEGLRAESMVVSDLAAIRAVPIDPTDDLIVATAMKAEAEFIVTGDRHLPVLGSHQAIQIVKPRQFLDLLR